MESEVDVSVLNSVNVKRFTKSVLEASGSVIDQSDHTRWQVEFGPSISKQLDRQSGSLVFDPRDREPGSGDLLVHPGTRTFSTLLDIVQQSASIGHLHLGEESLQLHAPPVLEESDLEHEITGFDEATEETALAFHFRVEAETPASFHREEMVTITIDPDTGEEIPSLSERLLAHLPQLLQENEELPHAAFSAQTVNSAYESAEQAAISKVRPLIKTLQTDAQKKVDERLDEIQQWNAQRYDELDQQLKDQRDKIRKWKKKERKARKHETRRRYIKNRKNEQIELKQLERQVAAKKDELDAKEDDEIAEVLERNKVNVEVSLLATTEISYSRGNLELQITSDHATASVSTSYLPATDEFHGLDCNECGQDLAQGIHPRLCVNGHVVGDPCTTSCRSCGKAHCHSCSSGSEFLQCRICWEHECASCIDTCQKCGHETCADHRERCSHCEEVTCHLCGEPCSSCGDYHCENHLAVCSVDETYHCPTHTDQCSVCSATQCVDHLSTCVECGERLCDDHTFECETCGDTLCKSHYNHCELCRDRDGEQVHGFCDAHTICCSVGGEVTCQEHGGPTPLIDDRVCLAHRQACSTCEIEYASSKIEKQCSACESLGQASTDVIPKRIRDDFRSVKVGANEAYLIILGKKLIGRNKFIVYDRTTREIVEKRSAGLMNQLRGRYR